MRLALASEWMPSARLAHRIVWLDEGTVGCAICSQLGFEENCEAVRAVRAYAAQHIAEWRRAVTRSKDELGVRVVDLTVVEKAEERVRVIFLKPRRIARLIRSCSCAEVDLPSLPDQNAKHRAGGASWGR